MEVLHPTPGYKCNRRMKREGKGDVVGWRRANLGVTDAVSAWRVVLGGVDWMDMMIRIGMWRGAWLVGWCQWCCDGRS